MRPDSLAFQDARCTRGPLQGERNQLEEWDIERVGDQCSANPKEERFASSKETDKKAIKSDGSFATLGHDSS